jgi:hypothetical protein
MGINSNFLMHKYLFKIKFYLIYLDNNRLFKCLLYITLQNIEGDIYFIYKLHIKCHHKKKGGRLMTFKSYINVFIYILMTTII